MNEKRKFMFCVIMFGLVVTLLTPAFSLGREKHIYNFQGVIERISKDRRILEVNEGRVILSSETKIVDERGRVLTVESLKPDLFVKIEALRGTSGFYAEKIEVKSR